MITTIETRLVLDKTQESEIDSCVFLWSEHYRKIWKLWNNQKLSETDIYHKLMGLNLLTSEQVGSLINKVKTEHNKIKELTKSQLKKHKAKLDNINKFIIKESKLINKHKVEINKLKQAKQLDYSKISKLTNSIQKKSLVLVNKQIKVRRLNKSIKVIQQRIETNTFKLCFGSSELLKQRPSNHTDRFRISKEQKVYHNLSDWKKDWDLSRNNVWYSVGRASKPQGNAEIQYYLQNNRLRLRVTEKESLNRLALISKELKISFNDLNNNKNHKYSVYRMKARFLELNQVKFCPKNQTKIIQAQANKKPISAKIIKKLTPNGKDIGYYLQLSFEEVLTSVVNINSIPLTMGIDLNQKGLAYCIVKSDGNKFKSKIGNNKPHGFIQYDLENKSKEQRQWLISNVITEVLAIAQEYGVYNIAIENLDFSSTVNQMNSGYKSNQRYNKMLTQFAKSLFQELIKRKTERLGLKLYLVNPTFSSIGGFTKYGLINKLPIDIAASLWLARQSIFGQSWKSEGNLVFIKKHNEEVSIPYMNLPKQSKKQINTSLEWKDISSALGKNRNLWYKNIMNFIQSKVDESLSEQRFDPFEQNQTSIS